MKDCLKDMKEKKKRNPNVRLKRKKELGEGQQRRRSSKEMAYEKAAETATQYLQKTSGEQSHVIIEQS